MTNDTGQGRLAENIVHFGRLLRDAGLSIGPGDSLHAIDAILAVGVTHRDDFYWALHAVLVRRHEDHDLFHQAFQIFWRNPRFLEQMRAALLPQIRVPVETELPELTRRLLEAVTNSDGNDRKPDDRMEFDAALTSSAREQLANKDFAQMSSEELQVARRMLKAFNLPQQLVQTRRLSLSVDASRIPSSHRPAHQIVSPETPSESHFPGKHRHTAAPTPLGHWKDCRGLCRPSADLSDPFPYAATRRNAPEACCCRQAG